MEEIPEIIKAVYKGKQHSVWDDRSIKEVLLWLKRNYGMSGSVITKNQNGRTIKKTQLESSFRDLVITHLEVRDV